MIYMLMLPQINLIFIGDQQFPEIKSWRDWRVLHHSRRTVVVVSTFTNLGVLLDKEERVLNGTSIPSTVEPLNADTFGT